MAVHNPDDVVYVMGQMARMSAEGAISIDLSTQALNTWFDMFDGGTTIDSKAPSAFEATWTSGYADIHMSCDLRNIQAGDAFEIEILKLVNTSEQRVALYSINYAANMSLVQEFEERCTTVGTVKMRIRQTAGTRRVVYDRFHGIGANVVS